MYVLVQKEKVQRRNYFDGKIIVEIKDSYGFHLRVSFINLGATVNVQFVFI